MSLPVWLHPEHVAGRANCPEFRPGERTVRCKSEHTTSRCCMRDQNLPSCNPEAECRDTLAVGNTNGPARLRKRTNNVRLRGNASCKLFLLRCCPGTNSSERDLYFPVSSLAGRSISLSLTAALEFHHYRESRPR